MPSEAPMTLEEIQAEIDKLKELEKQKEESLEK